MSAASSSAAARSLADDLRGRSDADLVDLLRRRPDLAVPPPSDLNGLAARACTRASVDRAVERLSRGRLGVLEAALVLDSFTDAAELASSLGLAPDAPEVALVGEHVDELWRSALLWRGERTYRAVRAVAEAVGRDVAGLGPTYEALARKGRTVVPRFRHEDVAAQVEAALERVSDEERVVLDGLARVGPRARQGGPQSADVAASLVAAGLLVREPDEVVVLPREVGIVLRGNQVHRDVDLVAPVVTPVVVTQSVSERIAGGSVMELLDQVDEVARLWGAEPPRELKSGGLSVRDFAGLSRSLDISAHHLAFILETMARASLLSTTREGGDYRTDPVHLPTEDYDAWLDLPVPARWARLASTWLTMTRAPHLVGRTLDAVGRVNALSSTVIWPMVRGLRAEVLSILAEAGPGNAVAAADVVRLMQWQRATRPAALVADVVPLILAEAEWLGLTGRGALTSAGWACLRAGDESDEQREPALAEAMAAAVPAPVDHVLLQADLTAVAPGPLEAELSAFMRLVADVESRGGATVFRFTPASVRRGLDAGWTASELLSRVREASRTPVPQPLEYLVTDVARRHGVARVGTAMSYLRSDDEALLETILARRELSSLRLRRLAPTVLVSGADASTLVDVLRENGFSPVGEGSDGATLKTVAARRRTKRGWQYRESPSVRTPDPLALVGRLRRAQERADAAPPDDEAAPPFTEPGQTVSILLEAIAAGTAVTIGVAGSSGGVRRMTVYPIRVEAGRLMWRTQSGQDRNTALHRLTGASLI